MQHPALAQIDYPSFAAISCCPPEGVLAFLLLSYSSIVDIFYLLEHVTLTQSLHDGQIASG